MQIRLGYDIRFETPIDVPFVALLNVHPSRMPDLLQRDEVRVEPAIETDYYTDSFGNLCCRFVAPAGSIRLFNNTLIADSGQPDPICTEAQEVPVGQLPPEVLQFLLASRYCEVDLMNSIATDLFGHLLPGWQRVQAICDWVNTRVQFGYRYARSTKTAMDVFMERVGVCRDFQHLAITFCRCMNIPARYATGYLGDIRIPASPVPMDFSAWFEAYLDGRWWTFDARHNMQRVGRVLMATGRDAADVALTTSFGSSRLTQFTVISDEVMESAPQSAFNSAPSE